MLAWCNKIHSKPLAKRAALSKEPLAKRAALSKEPLAKRIAPSKEPLAKRVALNKEPLAKRIALNKKHLVLFALLILSLTLSACGGSKSTKESAAAEVPAKAPEMDKNLAEAASKVQGEARRDFDKALQAMKAGNNAKAEALLRKVSDQHPDLSGPYVNLGLIKFASGDLDSAEKFFRQALSANPRSAISYNHIGIILRGKGEFKEAKRNYEMALDVNPDYANAHLNYGILLDLYLGDLESARAHYQKFQELSGEDKVVSKWIADLDLRIKRKKSK